MEQQLHEIAPLVAARGTTIPHDQNMLREHRRSLCRAPIPPNMALLACGLDARAAVRGPESRGAVPHAPSVRYVTDRLLQNLIGLLALRRHKACQFPQSGSNARSRDQPLVLFRDRACNNRKDPISAKTAGQMASVYIDGGVGWDALSRASCTCKWVVIPPLVCPRARSKS